MTPKSGTSAQGVYYGWITLAGVTLSQFVGGGCFAFSFGVFLPAMCDEFGWSRAVISTGLTLGLLCFGVPSPLWGALVTRFGPRAMLILGNTLLALGLAGMSLVRESWHVYIVYSIAGLGSGLGGIVASTTLANNWFGEKRSLAMGSISASLGLGGFAFPPLVAVIISSLGWRTAWLVLAGIVFLAASLIGSLIMVRNRPEDMGQIRDGLSARPLKENGRAGRPPEPASPLEEWTTGQALRQPATWLITTFSAAATFVFFTIIGHQVAYVEDLGFSTVTAATTMSLISGISILGSLGFGVAAMRLNLKNLTSISFGIRLIAFFLLLTTDNLALIYVYAVLFGISSGTIAPAMPTILGAYYGRSHYAQIIGLTYVLQFAAGSIGPLVAGAIYDATATYTPAFILLTALSFVGLICAFLARQPVLPRAG